MSSYKLHIVARRPAYIIRKELRNYCSLYPGDALKSDAMRALELGLIYIYPAKEGELHLLARGEYRARSPLSFERRLDILKQQDIELYYKVLLGE